MKVQSIQTKNPVIGAQTDNTVENSSDFSSYLQTTTSMEQIFEEASQTYGVSKNLLKAIAKAESDFNASATSKSGAQGVMQLMPATAAELGVSDAYNPYQNIMGGSKYISQLLAKYDNNVTLALAAYNAGSGNVAKYGGVPPFKETQNYVVKVAGYMNEEFNVSDIAYTTSGTNSVGDTGSNPAPVSGTREDSYYQSILDELFSYEDYLNFLDLYMKIQEFQSSREKEDQEESKKTDSYYSYQEIKYNPTVLNLLGGTEGI